MANGELTLLCVFCHGCLLLYCCCVACSGGGVASDTLIQTYSDHEDSVYAAAWSSYDAWIFATLSYDGRVCINHVPPAEKYKILL